MKTIGSLFAGIGGFDLGFERAGFKTSWAVEIDQKAQAVLRLRFPGAELHDDVTQVGADCLGPVDVVTFGSPCQDLSVAGKRAGLAGGRSGLFHESVRIIRELRERYGKPDFAIWENVPGAFSSNGGRDFAVVVQEMVDLGARDVAWRVLDSQGFGVPQRRRRIFLAADFGGERAAKVLAFGEGVPRDQSPVREEGDVTWWNGGAASQTLDAVLHKGQMMPEKNRFPVLAIGEELCFPQSATKTETARFAELIMPSVDVLDRLRESGLSTAKIKTASFGRVVLRRVTPTEACRLQGFSDDWNAEGIDKTGKRIVMADSSRYKQLGNAVTVNVAEWIARRVISCADAPSC